MSFQFDVLSILFAIIAILYMFMGLRKGFIYMFLYMVFPIIMVVLSLIIAQPLGRFIGEVTPLGSMFSEPFIKTISGLSNYFVEPNPGRDILATVISSNNYEVIAGMGIPLFIAPIMAAMILSTVPVAPSDVEIGKYVGEGAANAIIFLIAAVIVYVILSLILRILKKMVIRKKKKAAKEGFKLKPNFLSRIIGMGLGLFVSLVSVFIISYALELLFLPDPQLNAFLNSFLFLDNPEKMTVGKFIILNNPLKPALLGIFKTFRF